MKLILIMLGVCVSAASAPTLDDGKFDAKVCYKRCMDEVDDKAKCEYICYKKKSE